MILLLAVVAGGLAGAARARVNQAAYQVPLLRGTGLVILAVIPQLLAFHIPTTARLIPSAAASGILIISQALLLIFVFANRKQAGFGLLGTGLGLNLLVILLNGGWMPISPAHTQALTPHFPPDTWQAGMRFGFSKDMVLPAIRLTWLADRFLTPPWFPWAVVFSLGDVFIAVGVFWLLWSGGQPKAQTHAHPA